MSSWGLGNIIFEITIFTWVFKYLVLKADGITIFTWVFKYFVPKVDGYQVQKKFGVSKRILDFQFTGGFLFLRPRKCFIPRRDSAEQSPKVVQLFLLMSYFGLGNVHWTFNLRAVFCLFETSKMFDPPEGLCRAEPEGGPIVFTNVLFWVRKRILDFQFTDGFLPFLDLENVLSPEGTLQSRYRRRSNCFYLCLILG